MSDEDHNSTLDKLDQMHAKLAGALTRADLSDRKIRDGAQAMHDKINAEILRLRPKVERASPVVPKLLAKRYGLLLKKRKHLQQIMLKERSRIWDDDQGHPPAL